MSQNLGDHMHSIIELRTPKTLPPTAGYSHTALVAANAKTIYISGQVPMDVNGNLVGENNFKLQAEKVFENIGLALADAGANFDHLVKIGMYVTDMENLSILREVRDRFIHADRPPTSTLVQVTAFFNPVILFEMDAIAVIS